VAHRWQGRCAPDDLSVSFSECLSYVGISDVIWRVGVRHEARFLGRRAVSEGWVLIAGVGALGRGMHDDHVAG
jgi:hypothetical protein